MKMLRFRCQDCGLEMMVETKPKRCFECGSNRVIREGWKSRFKRVIHGPREEECVTD